MTENPTEKALPKLDNELYEFFPTMSASHHEYLVKQYAAKAISALTRPPAGDGEAVVIPFNIAEQVRSMGRVEWGATDEFDEAGHLEHLAKSLRMTREHFNFDDIPVAMHGLYLEGTETVLCHTGTSPNSGANAQALAGAWNWLVDQVSCPAHPPATPNSGAEDGVTELDVAAAKELFEYAGFHFAADHADMALDACIDAFRRHRLTSANTASEREKALRFRHARDAPKVGGMYMIGGYYTHGALGRTFGHAFAYVILTEDGPSWSHCSEDKAHIPIQYWCDIPDHPERSIRSLSHTKEG